MLTNLTKEMNFSSYTINQNYIYGHNTGDYEEEEKGISNLKEQLQELKATNEAVEGRHDRYYYTE